MTTPRVNVGTKGHCDHGINPMKAAFEAWYDNDDISEPLPDDYTILGKRYLYMGWCAATAEANKRMAELELEVQNWKDFCKKVQKIDFNDYLALQASKNDLREALESCKSALVEVYNDESVPKDLRQIADESHGIAKRALSATPAESLAKHDDELIKKCAKVCDKWIGLEAVADAIRALKEVK